VLRVSFVDVLMADGADVGYYITAAAVKMQVPELALPLGTRVMLQ
jgi:hypothetical protein